MIRVYGIKNCDTMKKAFLWLEEHGIAFEFIDYKKAGVVEAEIDRWCQQVGWEKLLNTRGLMWRKIDVSEKEPLNAATARRLMVQYPSVIKRPVVDTGKQLMVGFSETEFEQLIR